MSQPTLYVYKYPPMSTDCGRISREFKEQVHVLPETGPKLRMSIQNKSDDSLTVLLSIHLQFGIRDGHGNACEIPATIQGNPLGD